MAVNANTRSTGSERILTVVSVAYFFFVICSYYVIKPIRGSLALELGAANIPVLNIFSMLSLIAANAVYSWIVGKYKRDVFIPFITRFFVICLAIFWCVFTFAIPINQSKVVQQKTDDKVLESAVLHEKPEAFQADNAEDFGLDKPKSAPMSAVRVILIGSYYLWVNFFSLMAVSMFWSFMNDVFTVEQARRLYAIIGYGGLIGGFVGSGLTSLLVRHVGTCNLLILAIILLYPSVWCMQFIHKNHYRPEGVASEGNRPVVPAHPPRPWDGFLSVCKNPVLICMALEMFLYTFASTMFFQQLSHLIESEIGSDVNGRTMFIASLYSKINFVSFFSQFFVTRLMMKLANPVYGLLLLTLVQIVGTCVTLFNPSLFVASWVVVIRYALNYSTGRALRELVYIPLDREAKYQGKGFIDTVAFRAGDGISSVILIGGIEFYSHGTWIDYSIQIAMLIQFYVIIKTAGMYCLRLKTAQMPDTAPVPAS